jgi:hypothetical protein
MISRTLALQAIVVSTLLLFAPMPSQAAVYLYNLGTTYSGTSPAGPSPWASATIQDTGVNKVGITLSTGGLVKNEFVGGWYLNLDPLNASSLTFSSVPNATISAGSFSAGGGGRFDIFFNPSQSQGSRFGANQAITFSVSSTTTLNAAMFNTLSTPSGGNGTWITAAHIQSIGSKGEGSGWIGAATNVAVPEPSTYVLLGSLVLGLGFLKWRRAKA